MNIFPSHNKELFQFYIKPLINVQKCLKNLFMCLVKIIRKERETPRDVYKDIDIDRSTLY